LRPDYIAARPSAGGSIEFALVESKGTSRALNKLDACPTNWARQVRNAVVKLNGSVITIPRHLVVATRCNPNAFRPRTRRLQVRAWNSNSDTLPHDTDVLLEVVSAYYSGLCRNLGLLANLRALQLSASARFEKPASHHQFVQAEQEADSELSQQGHWDPLGESAANFEIALDVGTIHVQVADIAISLIRSIRSQESLNSRAGVIVHHLHELMDWYSRMDREYTGAKDIAIDRSGFIVKTGEIRSPKRL